MFLDETDDSKQAKYSSSSTDDDNQMTPKRFDLIFLKGHWNFFYEMNIFLHVHQKKSLGNVHTVHVVSS